MCTAFTTLLLMSSPLLLFPTFAHYLVAHTSLIPVPGKHFLIAVPRSLVAHFFISFLELKLYPFPNTSMSALLGIPSLPNFSSPNIPQFKRLQLACSYYALPCKQYEGWILPVGLFCPVLYAQPTSLTVPGICLFFSC